MYNKSLSLLLGTDKKTQQHYNKNFNLNYLNKYYIYIVNSYKMKGRLFGCFLSGLNTN